MVDSRFETNYRRLVDYARGAENDRADPADPADVLAMQMVLRIEKTDPPTRADTLTAAARAVALLCLDDRSAGDRPWADPMDAWCGARIRKIARRARGGHWVAAQQVWGVSVDHGSGAARALVPGRVGGVDKRISRLQIGGTELDGELPLTPDAGAGGVVLWVNPTLEMTVGKLAAQVGHGAMLAVGLMSIDEAWRWREAGCPLMVSTAEPGRWRQLLADSEVGAAVAIRDAGFTEIAPGSVTIIASRNGS